jgi:hypothetical protein
MISDHAIIIITYEIMNNVLTLLISIPKIYILIFVFPVSCLTFVTVTFDYIASQF